MNKYNAYILQKTNTNSLIFFVIVLLIVCYLVFSISIRPAIYGDPSWGFVTMKSMLKGGEFNFMLTPDPQDISKDVANFNSTWTPGQYIIPYFLIKYLNLNLGWSIIVTVFLMSFLGLVGYFKLFEHLKLPLHICWISLLIISSQRFFSLPFSIYNGGETMLFGFVPWILLYSLKLRDLRYFEVFIILLLGLFGFFLKSSFVITFYAICLSIFILKIPTQWNLKIVIKNAAVIVFLSLAMTVLCYHFFLSKGIYHDAEAGFQFNLASSIFDLSSGISAALSLDDIFNRLFAFPGNTFSNVESSLLMIAYYLIFAAITIFVAFRVYKLPGLNLYKSVFFSFLFTFVLIFLYFHNRISPVSSLEMRHFRPLGLIVVPAIILAISQAKNIPKKCLFILVVLSCAYGPLSFAQRKLATYHDDIQGSEGFTQDLLDYKTLHFIRQIDSKADPNTLLYVTSPEIALELKNLRYIATQADFESSDVLEDKKYLGSVQNLYILLPSTFETNGKEKIIINSFKNYKGAVKSKLSENYNVYKLIKI